VPDASNELLFSFMSLTLSAKGAVTFLVGAAVDCLIFAIARRLVSGT